MSCIQGHTHTNKHKSRRMTSGPLISKWKCQSVIFSQCHLVTAGHSMGQALDPSMRKVTVVEFQDFPWGSRCHYLATLSLALSNQSIPIQQSLIHYNCYVSSTITSIFITQISSQDLLPNSELRVRDCVISQ